MVDGLALARELAMSRPYDALRGDPLAPALYHCDRRVIVPRIADPAYVPTLAALCDEHDVRLVVPLNDLDFPVLAREREKLAPALVLLPDAEASASGSSIWSSTRDPFGHR